MKLEFWSEHRVEFYDIDSMNVMWHGNYVKIIESARFQFLESIGYEQMKKDHFVFPIVKINFKFIAPAFFKDLIQVKTTLEDCDIFLEFSYELFCNKRKIAKASTHQVALDLSDMRTQLSMPKKLLQAICAYKEKI